MSTDLIILPNLDYVVYLPLENVQLVAVSSIVARHGEEKLAPGQVVH